MGRDVFNVLFKSGEILCHPWCWTVHLFKHRTALRRPGDSALTGALPLLGLHHSATGGGLLTDLRRMACFCIKCDHRRRHDEQGKMSESSWLVIFTDAWIYEEDLLLADSKKAIFTLAPHERFHPINTYVKRF